MILKVVSKNKSQKRNHGLFISFCNNSQIRFSRQLKDDFGLDENYGAIFIEQINENTQPPTQHYYVGFVDNHEDYPIALRLRYDSSKCSLITLSTEVCDMFISTSDSNMAFKRQIVYDGDISNAKKPRTRDTSKRMVVSLKEHHFQGFDGITFYELLFYDAEMDTRTKSSKLYRKRRKRK